MYGRLRGSVQHYWLLKLADGCYGFQWLELRMAPNHPQCLVGSRVTPKKKECPLPFDPSSRGKLIFSSNSSPHSY